MESQTIRKLLAEYLGSLLLAEVVIGSSLAAQRLSPDDVGLQLLEIAAATAAALFAITLAFRSVSGGHFNPVVSFMAAVFGDLPWRDVLAYLPAQVAGCVSGAILANVTFDAEMISISTTDRATFAHGVAEVVATTGLLLVVVSLARSGRTVHVPAAVAAYTGAAFLFTSSNGFANPALTVGRTLSDSLVGISPQSAPTFIAAQLIGTMIAVMLIRVLHPNSVPPQTGTASPARHVNPERHPSRPRTTVEAISRELASAKRRGR